MSTNADMMCDDQSCKPAQQRANFVLQFAEADFIVPHKKVAAETHAKIVTDNANTTKSKTNTIEAQNQSDGVQKSDFLNAALYEQHTEFAQDTHGLRKMRIEKPREGVVQMPLSLPKQSMDNAQSAVQNNVVLMATNVLKHFLLASEKRQLSASKESLKRLKWSTIARGIILGVQLRKKNVQVQSNAHEPTELQLDADKMLWLAHTDTIAALAHRDFDAQMFRGQFLLVPGYSGILRANVSNINVTGANKFLIE